jgi:hypothetical protein
MWYLFQWETWCYGGTSITSQLNNFLVLYYKKCNKLPSYNYWRKHSLILSMVYWLVFLYRDLICQVIIIGVGWELKFAIRYFIALVEHGNIQNLKKIHLILHNLFFLSGHLIFLIGNVGTNKQLMTYRLSI